MSSRLVKLLYAGRISYGAGLHLQKALIQRHHDQCEISNSIILLEHEPVYTIGIRKQDYTDDDEIKLRSLGAEFYRTNRGGLITFHGPGQFVAYPIINLKEFKIGIRCYVSKIEKMIIRLCAEYGLKGETSPHTGVWVEDKKICAIGVHVSRYITSHGLALNCNTDLKWFQHIVPCGIEGKGVTSLSNELNITVRIEEVTSVFRRAFEDEFDCKIVEMQRKEVAEVLEECWKRVQN